MWNNHLLREFLAQPELEQFCIPLVHGFISIRNITINGKIFTFHLISRRSWHRAGKERERERGREGGREGHCKMVVFIIIIIYFHFAV